MPFVSDAQRKACWAKYHSDKRAGRKPQWDCKEWESAEMSNGSVYALKKLLVSYPQNQIDFLTRHYNLRVSDKNDQLWMIALLTYHGDPFSSSVSNNL